jgi:hypothetical protein
MLMPVLRDGVVGGRVRWLSIVAVFGLSICASCATTDHPDTITTSIAAANVPAFSPLTEIALGMSMDEVVAMCERRGDEITEIYTERANP